jgi:hypothetical protein
MLRLALALLAIFILVPFAVRFVFGPTQPPPGPQPPPGKQDAPAPKPKPDPEQQPAPPKEKASSFTLPEGERYPTLETGERRRLAQRLDEVGRRYGLQPPRDASASALTEALEALDARLGTPDPGRDLARNTPALQAGRSVGWLASPLPDAPLLAATALCAGTTGRLRDQGPIQCQLRAMLWKHGVAEYAVQGPNTVELLDRLEKHWQEKLSREGMP